MLCELVILAICGQISQNANSESEQAKAFAQATSQQYVVHGGESSKVLLSASPQPVFRWSNQLGRRFFGDVYVWTRNGRPEVIASITSVFGGGRRRFETEVHSLSTGRPTLTHNDRVVWSPIRPGVVFQPISNVLKPSGSDVTRLQQMRSIASRFAISAEYDKNSWQLRLLRSPIFRYEIADSKGEDGALFAFVKGTDPDAILIIESRESTNGQHEWQYALVRFNGNCSLQAKFDEVEVWRVEKLSGRQLSDRTEPYFSKRGDVNSSVAE